MSLPSDESFHAWDTGSPAGHGCSVMTNYKYWEVVKYMLTTYVWRDIQCSVNPEKIQGYICERQSVRVCHYHHHHYHNHHRHLFALHQYMTLKQNFPTELETILGRSVYSFIACLVMFYLASETKAQCESSYLLSQLLITYCLCLVFYHSVCYAFCSSNAFISIRVYVQLYMFC